MDAVTIFKKLRLNDTGALLIVNAPDEYTALLKDLAHDTVAEADKKYDFVQVFATKQDELERLCAEVKDSGKYDCLFWACYPKGTGKIKSDIKRETVWKALELAGVQAVTQIAIDDTWSALRGRPPAMVGK
jgi:ribosomal protein L25 (general stress protein Ctc)